MNVLRIKQGWYSPRNFMSSSLQRIWKPHMWTWWIPSYLLKCTIIGHSKKQSMILKFSHGRGTAHLLEILIPTLVIVCISLCSMARKKNYQQKILMSKVSKNLRTYNYKKKIIIIFFLGFKGVVVLWGKPPEISFNFIFQKWWKEKR